MMNLKQLLKILKATDLIVIIFALILSIVNIIFHQRIDNWLIHVISNTSVIFIVYVIAYLDNHYKNIFWTHLHYWYLIPVVMLSFKELYFMIDPIHSTIYDDLLIEIDRWLLGFDPTAALYSIENPYLTELLQIVYATFFFLPVILGIDLLLKNRGDLFDFEAFAVLYGFFLSYLGYMILPAIGPRFTLHDFAMNNFEMPGIFLADYLREIVNSGESIPAGTPNPAEVVQRDAFPSGHTQMTLIVMYLAYKFKTRSRYFLIPNGTLLIFSTVYLRYHYVIDLAGGFIFMIFTMWSGKKIFNWWMKLTGMKKFEYPEN
ncbi:MAG: phosphatase PAP2 family protein [Melioribacteraceae bacterium]|nr:phosphatase PAP2 family protein [Melioribacteraceae bacterium]MCF8356177.1 phosphatase PAP2 family protein [Melioribacteraceae bacterium]MCF8394748.1 phosphatase PAP2 family protein [Melioribacteraceae bacterium]MCF8417952.1 phosphatase PAP2 family protein [Melioribacteraceae bacterium]